MSGIGNAPEAAPGRRAPARPGREVNSDFTELARLIQASGLMRRRYGYYWAKLIGLPLLVIAVFAAFVAIGDTWWQLVTAVVLGILFTQVAFLGHDAAHRQIFVSGKWNDWTSLVIGDLFIGMSYGWWRHRHTRHHANPNKLGVDPDTELPVIPLRPEQTRHRSRLFRWLAAHQGLLFFPILPLQGIALHAASVQRVLARERVERRWIEIALLSIRLVGYAVLVFVVLSPALALVFLAVQLGVFGFYMGASFAPNHKGMPLVPADAKLGFLQRQVLTSRNIRGNRLLDVAMGGLNYQIEHHLFPSMARPHLRRAAPIVAEYCRARGIPYTETTLLQSYGIVIRHINRVGLGERDPFDCPLVADRRALG